MAWRACIFLSLLAAGCGFGSGSGALDGDIFVRGCSQSNDYGTLAAPTGYSMNPTFFVADIIDQPPYTRPLHPVNRVAIRMQSRGTQQEQADVLFVNVADVGLAAASLGKPLPLGPDTNVRAELHLNETCRYAESAMELDGTITFSSLGSATGGTPPAGFAISFGDRLAASLKVNVVDRRAVTLGGVGPVPSTAAVAGQLAGNFDFIVRPGKAGQPF